MKKQAATKLHNVTLTAWCPLLDFDVSLVLTVFLPQLAFVLICDAILTTHLNTHKASRHLRPLNAVLVTTHNLSDI